MSSPRLKENKNKRIDAILLAGGQEAKLFEIHGQKIHKPYLKLGGEPLVLRVARSLLQAGRIGNVYVVGDLPALKNALDPLIVEYANRIKLVPEGENLIDNCYRTFFLHLLVDQGLDKIESSSLDPEVVKKYIKKYYEYKNIPALFVTSDLPFITSQAVDDFVNLVPKDAEFTFGMVDHENLEKMHCVLGDKIRLDSWKLGALHLSGESVRLNNFFFARPLAANPVVYPLLLKLYQHRWLLKKDGSVNSRNWWSLSSSVIVHSFRLPGRLRFSRAMINFVPAVLAMFLARVTSRIGKGKWLSKPFRVFLRKRDMEFIGSLMVGIRGYLTMCPCPGPAFDIDVEDSYLSLIENDEQAFRMIWAYLEDFSKHIHNKLGYDNVGVE